MQDYDVLLTPTLATPPAALGIFEPRGLDAVLIAVASRTRLGPLVKWGDVLEQLVGRTSSSPSRPCSRT